jgi:hypothetical protein
MRFGRCKECGEYKYLVNGDKCNTCKDDKWLVVEKYKKSSGTVEVYKIGLSENRAKKIAKQKNIFRACRLKDVDKDLTIRI